MSLKFYKNFGFLVSQFNIFLWCPFYYDIICLETGHLSSVDGILNNERGWNYSSNFVNIFMVCVLKNVLLQLIVTFCFFVYNEGIWAGMHTVRYFDGKTYKWVGLSRQPNIIGKVTIRDIDCSYVHIMPASKLSN